MPPASSQISIVIPVHNREATLHRTLASIDAQTMSPAAVILVDNGSTDSSLSILHTWASSRPHATVVTEPRRGACAARNRGLAMVTTPRVMFFDSDDVMLPRHVEEFDMAARLHPDAGILGRDITATFLSGRSRRLTFTASSPFFHHIFRASLSTQRIVCHTDLVRSVGGWDETLPGWNDLELGVRLLLTSPQLHNLRGTPTVITYETPGSITGSSFSAHPGRWELSLQAIRRDLLAAGRADLMHWVDAKAMILAARYAAEGAPDEASRLREATLAATLHPHRMSLIYRHNLAFGRLTWMLARILFP